MTDNLALYRRMEANLAQAFSKETSCDLKTAYACLHVNNWDFQKAIENWKQEIRRQKEIESDVRKLSRGISRASDNEHIISKARNEVALLFQSAVNNENHLYTTPAYSFMLPDLTVYESDFRKYLEKDLIESSALATLENNGRLNWWTESGVCEKLWPLVTTGDGNCLLHAASLSIWGFHDRLLTLRGALYDFFNVSPHKESLYRRWRWQQTKLNRQSGFSYSEDEWTVEWDNIINMASAEPRRSENRKVATDTKKDESKGNDFTEENKSNLGRIYQSLEEIHILALAHILCRPIIVVADVILRDVNDQPFAPISFGGIYLPLEITPKDCHRSPLLLCYDSAHFSALVRMQQKDKLDKQSFVPLTDSEGNLLPVQFCVDPGMNFNWNCLYDQTYINSALPGEKDLICTLKKYLDIMDVSDVETTASPVEIDSEEEIEKRFIEVADLIYNDGTIFSHKNRAAKQLQSVAKQFGSIGKSVSKKLKKNFGSISRVPKMKKIDFLKNRIIYAEIHSKRHENQDKMIENYLQYMMKKFAEETSLKLPTAQQEEILNDDILFHCINTECDSFGTALTSYMCPKCYEKQKNEELNVNADSRFGTGRSKFYRDSDINSYDAVKRLPVSKFSPNNDQTLYLSKSTFYYDSNFPYEQKDYYSKLNKQTAPTATVTSSTLEENNNNNNIEPYYPDCHSENANTIINTSIAKIAVLPIASRTDSINVENNQVTVRIPKIRLIEGYDINASNGRQVDMYQRRRSENPIEKENILGVNNKINSCNSQNDDTQLVVDNCEDMNCSVVNEVVISPDPSSPKIVEYDDMNYAVVDNEITISPSPSSPKIVEYDDMNCSVSDNEINISSGPSNPNIVENNMQQKCKTVTCMNKSASHSNSYCMECFKKHLQRMLPP